MASITYDGQSFLLDGRRVWLVSGSIPFARAPRAMWADLIHTAKQSGLNCIETQVVWARHEARQGHFDFTGDNDIREFVRLIGQAGLYCILRPGPFVDGGFDMGGLPPWLTGIENLKLRTANQPFLEACSRYITALAGQLRDLQVNSHAPKGSPAGHMPGPIILVQNESGWTCGDDHLAETYLGELDRYYREAGFGVPIINANDLWQSVEGEIDGWTGYDGLLSHLRQLGSIRPAQPRIVIDLHLLERQAWASDAPAQKAPGAVLRRLAEVLAAGGQFNIDGFFGGTNFGFSAGREPALGPAGFLTSTTGPSCAIGPTGRPTALQPAVRRVCTFASRFARVLAHLDPARQPVALLPETGGDPGKGGAARVSVIHALGSQGGVVFVFGDDSGHNSREPMNLLLPDGSTLPVDLGDQSAVWCLLDTRLTGRANLDYCNLCALGLAGKVFVCFGTPGQKAVVSINGSPLETTVPSGKSPLVQEHEGITVVIASQEQTDHIHLDETGVYLGVLSLGRDGKPVLDGDARSYIHLDVEGKSTTHKAPHPHAPAHGKKHGKPHLGEWACAPLEAYLGGTSPRFANITKPADLVSLGAPYGYGWYRIKLSSGSARKVRLMFPHAAHRLHLTLDGEPAGLAGVGLGAEGVVSLNLKKGSQTLVALAENLGRVCSGSDLGEQVGLYGHAWEIDPIRAGKPRIVAADPVDVLGFRAPLWRMHRDDRSDAARLTWTIDHRKKTSIIVQIGAYEAEAPPGENDREGGILLLNGKPVHFFQQGGVRPVFIDNALLLKGKNEFQIALMGPTRDYEKPLADAVHFFEAVDSPTVKADWAFAKWEAPAAGAYGKGKHHAGHPCWWKTTLTVSEGHEPLMLELAGLSKGQVLVNGKHLGRYFVGTPTGRKVPPQTRYFLPRSMLKGEANELAIFDEHGFTPSKVRVTTDSD